MFLEASSIGVLQGGSDYRNSYVFVIGIREERIVLWREYFNSLTIVEAAKAMAAVEAS